MNFKPKPLSEQVLLITGASSGIGLITAQQAARQGAKVILISRNAEALEKIVSDITAAGGVAVSAVADVGDEAQFKTAVAAGIAKFGRIDTWINNAGVGMFGKIKDVPKEDDKRLFETNFWGVVNGSRLAMDRLKQGGTLINVGSVVSDRAVPLQGMYSASKHAVLGFTDALRMEIEEEGLPINVTLIKPSAIDTPYAKHAKNHLEVEPTLPPPVYAPELVAQMILHAAENPARDYYVGGGGRLLAALGRQLPRIMDLVMEKTMFGQQKTDRPARPREDNTLHSHSQANAGEVHGGMEKEHFVMKSSAYDTVSRHPWMTLLGVAALGGVVYTLAQARTKSKPMYQVADRLKGFWSDIQHWDRRNGKR